MPRQGCGSKARAMGGASVAHARLHAIDPRRRRQLRHPTGDSTLRPSGRKRPLVGVGDFAYQRGVSSRARPLRNERRLVAVSMPVDKRPLAKIACKKAPALNRGPFCRAATIVSHKGGVGSRPTGSVFTSLLLGMRSTPGLRAALTSGDTVVAQGSLSESGTVAAQSSNLGGERSPPPQLKLLCDER